MWSSSLKMAYTDSKWEGGHQNNHLNCSPCGFFTLGQQVREWNDTRLKDLQLDHFLYFSTLLILYHHQYSVDSSAIP